MEKIDVEPLRELLWGYPIVFAQFDASFILALRDAEHPMVSLDPGADAHLFGRRRGPLNSRAAQGLDDYRILLR